ncbi:hypothetical protein GGD56_006752 [Rhizobium mongolense]|uniref:Uncharacterized protein n=2 Tax=Rhizobium mongolense TaxID=57676 RepID=A0ABR6IY54_9HYPH|nr:hypothetical protein [Rhizobium mongolense]TVZ75124.1 hypothetical protein BCL32_0542 [Rhizobium mongolense USDA 1844]
MGSLPTNGLVRESCANPDRSFWRTPSSSTLYVPPHTASIQHRRRWYRWATLRVQPDILVKTKDINGGVYPLE